MGPLPPGEKETTNRGRLSPPPPASLNLVCLWHRGWGPFSRSGFLGTWPGCPSPTPASPAKTFVVSTSWPFSRKPGVGVGGWGVPQGPPSSHAAGSHQQPLREDEGCIRAPGGGAHRSGGAPPAWWAHRNKGFWGQEPLDIQGRNVRVIVGQPESTKPPAACYASPRWPPIPRRPGAVTGTQTGPPLRKASDMGLQVAQLLTPRKEAISERTSPNSPAPADFRGQVPSS